MKQIHYVNIMYICIVLLLFFYAESVKAITYQKDKIDQGVMRQMANFGTLHIHEFLPTIYDNGCECIAYHCRCCVFIKWDLVHLNGKLCANISYLEHNEDYKISMILTYNDITLLNEIVTARKNPQPICIENFAGLFSICLQIYDININSNGIHICFKNFAKIMNNQVYKIKLGCIG